MKLTRALIVIGAALVLGLVNHAIAGKERIKQDGQTIFLKLRPVDPRSIMQGDYMALRFELAEAIEAPLRKSRSDRDVFREGKRVLAPIELDERGVATLAEQGAKGDAQVRYRLRSGRVWLGTNALFFEEGTAHRYTGAQYGEFKLDRETGEAVLIGLRDGDLKPL